MCLCGASIGAIFAQIHDMWWHSAYPIPFHAWSLMLLSCILFRLRSIFARKKWKKWRPKALCSRIIHFISFDWIQFIACNEMEIDERLYCWCLSQATIVYGIDILQTLMSIELGRQLCIMWLEIGSICCNRTFRWTVYVEMARLNVVWLDVVLLFSFMTVSVFIGRAPQDDARIVGTLFRRHFFLSRVGHVFNIHKIGIVPTKIQQLTSTWVHDEHLMCSMHNIFQFSSFVCQKDRCLVVDSITIKIDC